jgi:tRNA dimethylallyltransferase
VDPESARRIRPADRQRIQRALEVWELTGRPLSELQQRQESPLQERPRQLILASADRERARRRIEARFHGMLERGFVEEVERLYGRGDLSPALPSMRLVGYRQIWRHLAGELDRPEMIRQAVIATRQLAKRQRTWARGLYGAEWFDTDDSNLVDKVLKFLERARI